VTDRGCDCLTAGQDAHLQQDLVVNPLLPALMPWLVGRRWFTHEHGCMRSLHPVDTAVLQDEATLLVHLVAEARYETAPPRRYQILVGARPSLPANLAKAAFGRVAGGRWDGWWLYEATEDPHLMNLLLARTADGRATPYLHLSLISPEALPTGLTPRLLAVEQSNSSVVYGNRLLLKLFRQPAPGPHPETQALAALTEIGSSHTPRLTGWLHTGGPAGDSTVLGIIEDFLPSQGDGWELAVRQATDAITMHHPAAAAVNGFTQPSHELGEAVAQVHRALARAFPAGKLTTQQILDQSADMERRLKASVAAVPALEPYADRICAFYDEYAQTALHGPGIQAQRVHGDLHLGQVLKTADTWMVIDFEGEPSRPVSERTLPQSPLRDVAGMLRSFDYAAQHALRAAPGEPDTPGAARTPTDGLRRERCAQAWTVRNRAAFCAGYAAVGGVDPRCHPFAMRAFELDKAVYEAGYEAAHRPDWLPVPMAAIRKILSRRPAAARTPAAARGLNASTDPRTRQETVE
jgi:maltokinase